MKNRRKKRNSKTERPGDLDTGVTKHNIKEKKKKKTDRLNFKQDRVTWSGFTLPPKATKNPDKYMKYWV